MDDIDGRSEDDVTEQSRMVAQGPPALPPRRVVPAPAGARASLEVRLPTRVDCVSRKGVIAQCLVAAAVFLLATGGGFPIGFSSVLLHQLMSNESSIPTDADAASWIASMHAATVPIGTIMSGPLMERIGRNLSLQVTSPFAIISWLLLAFAKNHDVVLVGRALGGLSVGLMGAPAQVLLGEIAEPRMRGILIGSPFVFFSFGILLVYLLGYLLDWRVVCGLALVFPVAAAVALHFLPESPVWLVRVGRLEKAQQALDWLRGGPGSVQSKVEMEQLVQRMEAEKGRGGGSLSCWQLFSSPLVVKPMVIMNIYNATQILAGTYTIIFYAVDLLQGTVPPSVNAQVLAVLTAATRSVLALVGCILLLNIGRRPLAIASASFTALSALMVGVLVRWGWGDVYLPSALLILYVGANTCGMFMLPGIMIGELLPARVRGICGALTFCIFNVIVFAYAKAYPFLKDTLGRAGMFYLFAASALVNGVIAFLFLPEAAGRSLPEIEDYFAGDNWLWFTRPRRRPLSLGTTAVS